MLYRERTTTKARKKSVLYLVILTSAGKQTLLPEPAVLGYLCYYTRDSVVCQVFFEK